jgi:hypothetical protein
MVILTSIVIISMANVCVTITIITPAITELGRNRIYLLFSAVSSNVSNQRV